MKFLYLDTVNMVWGNFSAGIPVHIVVICFSIATFYNAFENVRGMCLYDFST